VDLKGRTVLVTGGASGLGGAVVDMVLPPADARSCSI
jgi:NAD(P)-dependent dehydrogenase (short-subunit alcohol dehydrogenase family)